MSFEPGPQPFQPPVPQTPDYGPRGEIVLNLRKPFGAMGMISPSATIDGFPVTVQWGRNAIPAPIGVRHVSVAAHYLWTYGRASRPVTVEPGRPVEAFYSPPLLTFIGGAMGLTEQRRPGAKALIVMLVILGALLLLSVIGAVLASTGS